MSRFHDPTPIPFNLPGGCLCTGGPHEEDIVYFRPSLSVEGGIAANSVIDRAREAGLASFTDQVQREMGWVLMFHGIVGWNLLDDDGQPVPVTEQALRSLGWDETTSHLVDKASDLYGEEAFAPFQRRLRSFSARSQTGSSTSRSRPSSRSRSPRSKPSSPTTTAASTPSSG